MKCLKEKCIHHDVCALYTFSGYASDECGFYETRPHGEWIDRSDGGRIRYPFWERYECSKCGAKSENTNFCPQCGSDNRPKGKKNCDNCFLSTGEQCDILVPSENCEHWKPFPQ